MKREEFYLQLYLYDFNLLESNKHVPKTIIQEKQLPNLVCPYAVYVLTKNLRFRNSNRFHNIFYLWLTSGNTETDTKQIFPFTAHIPMQYKVIQRYTIHRCPGNNKCR